MRLTSPPASVALTIPKFAILNAERDLLNIAESNLTSADLPQRALLRSRAADLEGTSSMAKNGRAGSADAKPEN